MGYYDDDDVEEQIKNLDKLEQGLRLKQQRDFMKWRDQTVNDELKKAAEDLGVSPEDFARHMSDPNYEKDLRRATRKLVERASQRVGGKAKPVASTRRESVERKGRPSGRDMDEMRSRAQRGQLSDDELCDLLPRLIR